MLSCVPLKSIAMPSQKPYKQRHVPFMETCLVRLLKRRGTRYHWQGRTSVEGLPGVSGCLPWPSCCCVCGCSGVILSGLSMHSSQFSDYLGWYQIDFQWLWVKIGSFGFHLTAGALGHVFVVNTHIVNVMANIPNKVKIKLALLFSVLIHTLSHTYTPLLLRWECW